MTTFQIVEGKARYCGQMSRLLRSAHRDAVTAIGVDAHRELRDRFEASAFRRAWLVDGRLGALGGVVGSPLATEGFVWLAIAESALRHPIAVAREAGRQIDRLMKTRRALVTVALDDDPRALRFALRLGFEPMNDETGTRWRRVAVGSGTAVALRYVMREAA